MQEPATVRAKDRGVARDAMQAGVIYSDAAENLNRVVSIEVEGGT